MMKKIIKTVNAPSAVGPYSQGIDTGDFIFTAGQIPLDPETGTLIEGSFKLQVRRVLDNINGILSASGSGLSQAIKMTVFVTDLNNFPMLNDVFKEYFGEESPPARSAVEVSALPLCAEVEIECIATK